jgi:23S rRNA pseudouridine1911/1915/1917 synthase
MNKIFRDHDLKKIYWAVLESSPPEEEGHWSDYIRRDREKNRSFLCDSSRKDSQKATLSYRTICRTRLYVLVEVDLETGRHHQIRAQFSGRGCPVKGDVKYGAREANRNSGIHLHARQITFIHPVSQEALVVTAPVPRDDLLWQELEEAVLQGKLKTNE